MKKTLQIAIEANDLPQVRSLLIEMIRRSPGNVPALEDITETISSVPGLFEPDDGKTYAPSARDMTETLIDSLLEDLSCNFSLPKFRLYTETQALRHADRDYYSGREIGNAPADEYAGNRKNSGMIRRIAYIIMALGAAAVIVSLCVSLKFLLGIGIGVIMLGSAVGYRGVARIRG